MKCSKVSLHEAVRSGNVNLVKEFIRKGVSLEAVDECGKRPIHVAIKCRQNEVLDILISHKCDVNAVCVENSMCGNQARLSPLCLATECRNSTAFEALIEAGADVNAANADTTPLLLCILLGLEECARILINKQARVDEIRKNMSPLHLAVMYSNIDMADLLLSNGASVNIRDLKMGTTPLHVAIASFQLNFVELLVRRGADVNAWSNYSDTPLSISIDRNIPEMVELLLANGAHVNYVRNWQQLQMIVATSNTEQVLKLLLKYGLRLDERINENNTPLKAITNETNIEIIQILLDNNVKFNSFDNFKLSPIHYASFAGHVDAVQLFMAKGVSVDCCAVHNWTPLHIAAGAGYGRLVEFLLLEGADVNKKDSFRRTPLFYALKGLPFIPRLYMTSEIAIPNYMLDLRTVDKINEYSKQRRKIFKKDNNGVKVDANTIVTILIRSGAHIDLKFFDSLQKLGDTILNDYIASYSKLKVFTDLFKGASENNVNLVKACINEGTVVDSVAGKLGTPLTYACKLGSGQVVEALLSSGANPNFKTDTEMTPLHYASLQGDVGIIISLLWKGAMYDAQNSLRRKPIYYANKGNHAFIVHLFRMIEKLFHSARNGDSAILSSLTILKNAYSSKRSRIGIYKTETPYQLNLFFIIKNSSGENLAEVAQANNNSMFLHYMWDTLQIE